MYIRNLVASHSADIPVNKFEWGPWVWLTRLTFLEVKVTATVSGSVVLEWEGVSHTQVLTLGHLPDWKWLGDVW